MSRVIVLIATIPVRRASCERLLRELTKQSLLPDGVALALDGYGDAPAPVCSLPLVLEKRTDKLSGAGNRWRLTRDLPADDIVVCLDDDLVLLEAPRLIEKMAAAVELGGAGAAMGRSADGKMAPPSKVSRGALIHASGAAVAARSGVFAGASDLAAEVFAAGGADPFGPGGDDDALISAHLWKSGVTIAHVPVGNIFPSPGVASTYRGKNLNEQRSVLRRITGWPWPGEKGIVARAH